MNFFDFDDFFEFSQPQNNSSQQYSQQLFINVLLHLDDGSHPDLIPKVSITLDENNQLSTFDLVEQLSVFHQDLHNYHLEYQSSSDGQCYSLGQISKYQDQLLNYNNLYENYNGYEYPTLFLYAYKSQLSSSYQQQELDFSSLEAIVDLSNTEYVNDDFDFPTSIFNDSPNTTTCSNGALTSNKPKSSPKKVNAKATISQIKNLVREWKSLAGYNSNDNCKNTTVFLTLNEAAEKLNIARKTLDEYQLMINSGERLGFDFQANQNKKFGVLRQFVRETKRKNRLNKKENILENEYDNINSSSKQIKKYQQ